jgi:hypothetical protein
MAAIMAERFSTAALEKSQSPMLVARQPMRAPQIDGGRTPLQP